jgi:quercetin dioxygenase-like cupin family protein
MKIFTFDERVSREITSYGSVGLQFSRIARLAHPVSISYMQISPHGVIGYHQATTPQLFLVVQGQGWVRGDSEDRLPIERGNAAYWDAGEWHETGTDSGMSAVVIEVEDQAFNPGKFLQEITTGER